MGFFIYFYFLFILFYFIMVGFFLLFFILGQTDSKFQRGQNTDVCQHTGIEGRKCFL